MQRELPNAIAALDLASARLADHGSFAHAIDGIATGTMMTLFTSGLFELGQQVMSCASDVAARSGTLADAVQYLFQTQILAERAFNSAAATAALSKAELIGVSAEGEALGTLCLMRSSAAEIAGNHGLALQHAQQAYDLFEDAGSALKRSAAFHVARALEFGGEPSKASPYYKEALERAEQQNDPINQGAILHHIGNCEAYAEQWQPAMHAYRRAAELFVSLDAVEFISNALGEAGIVAAHLDPLIGLPNVRRRRARAQNGGETYRQRS